MQSPPPIHAMWADALDMLERAGRLHRQFFQVSGRDSHGPTWEPPADVFETAHYFTIWVALPGVAERDVTVTIDDTGLIVTGQRVLPVADGVVIRRVELPFGRFVRRIELPQGRYRIGARVLAAGCLRLELRKLAQD